ncbi:peptidase, partial [Flavobacterium circumlabens]
KPYVQQKIVNTVPVPAKKAKATKKTTKKK